MRQPTGSISTLKKIIPIGRKNAITTASLMEEAGYSNTRMLRHDIRQLRIEGEVILSSTQKGGGYYRPQNSTELLTFIKQEEHRAKSIFYALKTARKQLKKYELQADGKETKS